MERIDQIRLPDEKARAAAQEHWDSIAKPLGSFGEMEHLITRIAAVQGCEIPSLRRRTAVVLCADHGVVEEGVTQTGSEVTALVAQAVASGTSNVNSIADSVGCEVLAVDLGMKQEVSHPALLNRKIAYGTKNIARYPAMTRSQCEQAIMTGMDIVRDLKAQGTEIILTGEMGIGNTTPTGALASVLLGLPPETVTGRGAGLDDAGLDRKCAVVRAAVSRASCSADDPVGLLSELGGFEIAGMTGMFLGGAVYRVPVVIDGVISAAAACIAKRIAPLSAEYMLASHCSGEPAGEGLTQYLGLEPVIRAGLRLGEGTGALLLLPLLDSALALYCGAHRFDTLHIKPYEKLS
jgi:nicotinate-nucleotide--dimethylbenzimidazole phosphoribosyltransferase